MMGLVMPIGRIGMIVEDMWHTKDLGKLKVLGKYKYLNGNYMV